VGWPPGTPLLFGGALAPSTPEAELSVELPFFSLMGILGFIAFALALN